MAGLSMDIKLETRLCEVNGEFGYFHCWEHWSNVIDASPLRGGHPGGHIYNGFSCGIDPLAKDLFEVWCGDDAFSVSSVDEVLNDELFDGRSLTDIWDDVTDLDF